MSEAIRPSLYTLPFGADLCDSTVDLVTNQCGHDPLLLSRAIIFLPNNRAIRAMSEAFVRRAKPGLLMPRLVAIGDLALDEALAPMLDPLDGEVDIPALIAPLERQLLLAKMVQQQHLAQGRKIDVTEAMRLAGLLAGVIDELDIEQIGEERFEDIGGTREIADSPDLAGHWQSAYASLLNILPQYRAKLSEMNKDGPAAIRNLLLARLAQRLFRTPEETPIFASGISTAAPAIAKLLSTIAKLPNGHVVLPPVDLSMSDADWSSLLPDYEDSDQPIAFGQETHPQFHLRLLLERMGVARAEIEMLGIIDAQKAHAIPQIFCLPATTTGWTEIEKSKKQLESLRLAVTDDSAEEARAIAILVREGLETPERCIAIATPDRELAVRISEQLKRWNIEVDDTAGTPLLQTPQGTLWMALLEAVASKFSAVSILAIAKHPLVQPENRMDWLAKTRQLDLELRGPANGTGLQAITKQLDAAIAEKRNKWRLDVLSELKEWWLAFERELSVLDKAASGKFADRLESLIAVAGSLSEGVIWKKAAGRQLSAFLEELCQHDFDRLGEVERDALLPFFAELASGQVVRPAYGGHPRISLFGLLEARLQQADLLICAGLNEGSWPQLPSPDPWLAPRIRRQLGLPALERNIGLSAHDLASALGAKECVITRSKRDRAGPTIASRFLLRIEAYLGENLCKESKAIVFARQIDRPDEGEINHFAPPEIYPSAAQRQIKLSATDFDRLLSDPFAIYAKRILRTVPLDDVNGGPTHAWRGTFVHDILEKWADEDKGKAELLMKRVDAALADATLHPNLRILWQPRILKGLRWVAEETARQMDAGRELLLAEVDGEMMLVGVRITGKVDRIDKDAEGNLVIIDYKTGAPPTPKQIEAGFALQLGLMGYMAEQNGFNGVTGRISGLEYWSLAKDQRSKNDDNPFGYYNKLGEARGKQIRHTDDIISDMVATAEEALNNWINGDAAYVAKLRPEFSNYADYDQLSRLQEWDARQSAPKGSAAK